MKFKERIKLCFQILFKGRDINKELGAVEQERIKLAERMKEQLELLINDEKLNMVSNPDRSLIEMIHIADIETAPVSYFRERPQESRPYYNKEMNFRLERLDGKYIIKDHPHYIARMIEQVHQQATEDLARELVRRKLIRVETLEDPMAFDAKILRFSVNIYKGF